MSAYGAISRAQRTSYLHTTLWDSPQEAKSFVTIHHIDRFVEHAQTDLFNFLHSIFANEVDKGLTYPQEDIRDPEAFRAYFFGGDVLVAIAGSGDPPAIKNEHRGVREIEFGLDTARNGRTWEACVAGFYYVSLTPAYAYTPICYLTRLLRFHRYAGKAQLPWAIFTCKFPFRWARDYRVQARLRL
jgi:hypothetical protein